MSLMTDLGLLLKTKFSQKQDNLVSGTNIKTINSESIVGTGNILVSTYTPPTNMGADNFLSGDGTYKLVDLTVSWDEIINKPTTVLLTESYTATAGQTTINISYIPDTLSVYKNGLKLRDITDYTATNGTSVVFISALTVGDKIDITGFADSQVFVVYDKVEVDTLVGDMTLLLDAINGEAI